MKRGILLIAGFIAISCTDENNDCGCVEYKTSVGQYRLNECEINTYEVGWDDFVTEKEMEQLQKEHHCE